MMSETVLLACFGTSVSLNWHKIVWQNAASHMPASKTRRLLKLNLGSSGLGLHTFCCLFRLLTILIILNAKRMSENTHKNLCSSTRP